jgi:hypothetical protein
LRQTDFLTNVQCKPSTDDASVAKFLQARSRQHIPYAGRKSDVFDKRIVRQFRYWIYQTSFAHFLALLPEFGQTADWLSRLLF